MRILALSLLIAVFCNTSVSAETFTIEPVFANRAFANAVVANTPTSAFGLPAEGKNIATNVLGRPESRPDDEQKADFDNEIEGPDIDGDDTKRGFVAVTFGVSMTDQPGDDIAIHLTNFIASEPFEQFEVLVGNTLTSLTSLGLSPTPAGQTKVTFDFGDSGLASADILMIRNGTEGGMHVGPEIIAIEIKTIPEPGSSIILALGGLTLVRCRAV